MSVCLSVGIPLEVRPHSYFKILAMTMTLPTLHIVYCCMYVFLSDAAIVKAFLENNVATAENILDR
jgi:hypothetical protein